ncbi:TetR/AcrR family transcriptional regulator [Ferdinandcohnia quinoae]|uniref:TetR/AcrR family transcriptional regulator n=1 Tax=Fredinandcohnia quinoae TaxID=2918902 RepID=A0AAW5DV14_9BACI|nr:TetR/AcrR family transcriptional regulator [Fredinandcohnia sp. SECRCQ15]MCH1624188.1 TetR/AcrR family transcriptional regulator [Fredinandcohnia sp. SECRCQ15]
MAGPREKIIDATIACIEEKGSASISLRDISKKAGVALSQIHYYFSGKEGLLIEVASNFMMEEQEEIKSYLSEIKEPIERIEKAIDFLREQYQKNPMMQKVYFELMHMGNWNPLIAEKTRILHEKWIEMILQDDLAIGITDRSLARFIVVFLDGLAMHSLQGVAREEIDKTFDFFRGTIKNYIEK